MNIQGRPCSPPLVGDEDSIWVVPVTLSDGFVSYLFLIGARWSRPEGGLGVLADVDVGPGGGGDSGRGCFLDARDRGSVRVEVRPYGVPGAGGTPGIGVDGEALAV